ncbi:MAG TPA: threonine--tRNA ligase [Spirochaetota bacterium]|nr:threonine--tRNA ligase [Spirochaetota bacterium]OPZ37778.1 MAG: Threonine--tRNA ligase 1 [Spirochaetes bacterium ADurb.BinA120]HNU90722.1 threonine--tRNA ligase [Spirochaetota bacterium]HPV96607.1 threonine--tRNA ligase [Spirochaetota bacterium]
MSSEIKITLPDGSSLSVEADSSIYDIAGKIGKKLQKAALVAAVNDRLVDLFFHIKENTNLKLFTFASAEGKDAFWHSASHLLAQAVKRLFPGAKFAIGPSIENGFYYDFEVERNFTPEDLEKIEAEMAKIVAEDIEVVREEMPRQKAIEYFSSMGESYKVELLMDLPDGTVSLYRQGEFVDLCRGPHLPRTSYIKAFKLLSIAGAYWRGDEKRPMLQRIYGTAWPTKEELDAHLKHLDEVEKRDHRKLGRELDLYSIHEETGAGLILWHPKGARLRHIIETFWREEHYKNGYDLVYSPHIGKSTLWDTSGHLGFYSENMYSPMDIDGQDYYVKPMNCPFHIMIYKSRGWSYRDLPLRWAELGTVYRYERSGVLHGLLRVRGFTQDDAHLVCRPDQMPDEIDRVLDFCLYMLRSFGFSDFKVYLATRPGEKFVGDEAMWSEATRALRESVERAGIDYEVDEGGGAFYGPKIDIKIKDALGREWQCSTIQFDFNMPERFDVTYVGSDGQKHRPYMIHRALLGSIERFVGVLVEHYAGRFPMWLSPVQLVLINVVSDAAERTARLRDEFAARGLRVESDLREETIGYKVRDAIEKKVPFVGVIGKKEMESGSVSVRRRGENASRTIPVDEFAALLETEAARKS